MNSHDKTYDPRSVANLLLDIAIEYDLNITNLALQKLLYFCHALHLIKHKSPLVSGYFEAWKFGPVHPVVYNAFKSSGNKLIDCRANKTDILTGQQDIAEMPRDDAVLRTVRYVLSSYGQLSPGRLVDISHAKGAPWHYVVSKTASGMALGMRIPEDVILERFKHHKVALSAEPRHGEPGEESPYSTD